MMTKSRRAGSISTCLDRRTLLRAGTSASLATLLPALLDSALARAEASPKGSPASKIRSCILIFYYGGPSHLDTWDLKPDAPAAIRGEFRPIATRVPGLQVCEHLPHSARIADKLTIVRSMHHAMRNHNAAAVEALCGRTPTRGDQELLADDTNAFPCYGAAISKLAAAGGGMPTHVALPHVMYNVVVLPGQTAGFLGPAYNPVQVTRDPNDPQFRVDELRLPDDISADRLLARQSLLASVESSAIGGNPMDVYQEKAFSLLRSEEVRRAFEIGREPDAVRDRYGRNKFGQSLLLARRLVEAGVRFVNVNDKVRNNFLTNWDSHQNNLPRLKDDLLPPSDLGFAALIEDIQQRGLLDSTLVVALGEFGRTPTINKLAGRDHWPDCFTAVLAGGGVHGGMIYGSSDKNGAYPNTDPVTPGDLAATLFWRFGLDPGIEWHDQLGRPQKLATGQPLTKLFAGPDVG
ncbi:MAG TPA: DUF1501 domain-containing protein [Pirellulales bacterium]|jgi:uncharacterized protein (DUF1501 family)|nr:DUF1501 domain-containing protein [Pirellulales bacterium]